METTLGRPRRVVAPIAALLAVGLLAAMVVSGHLRESKQFIKFVPAGVMPEAAATIDRVEIGTSTSRRAFVRAPGGWRAAGSDRSVPASLAAHLDNSVKFMHVAAPIRVMERAEWGSLGLREFGLDPPGYTATLYRHGAPVLRAEFGAPNPQRVLQYMKLGGRDQVYLMPRFIGEEWEKVFRQATTG